MATPSSIAQAMSASPYRCAHRVIAASHAGPPFLLTYIAASDLCRQLVSCHAPREGAESVFAHCATGPVLQ